MIRKTVALTAMAGALAIALHLPASAFQQTDALPKPAPSTPGATAPAPSTLEPGELELIVPGPSSTSQKGPTLSLPGVGTIGTLPKLDFGLELLYGDEPAAATPEDEALDGDLRIRGSVKHKF